jgi:hypothetical protein
VFIQVDKILKFQSVFFALTSIDMLIYNIPVKYLLKIVSFISNENKVPKSGKKQKIVFLFFKNIIAERYAQ